MRILLMLPMAICTLLLFTPSTSDAEIYKWTDENNVLHIVDSVHKIPEKYRKTPSPDSPSKKNINRKAPNKPSAKSGAPPRTYKPAQKPPTGENIYGGKSLEWWKGEFSGKRSSLAKLKMLLSEKQNFVDIYERGRRIGQIFDKKDISSYKKYTKEIPKDKKTIATLEKELKIFIKQARNASVPKSVRGK